MTSPAARESVVSPKYARGQHPNSRANLKAPWQPGQPPPSNPTPGPRVKPALYRFADMTVEEFKKLNLQRLTVAEMVALQALQKAAFDGEFGDKMRQFVTDKMDGSDKGGDTFNIDKALLVRYVEGPSGSGTV